MSFWVLDPAELFEDLPEIFSLLGTEESFDVFCDSVSWVFSICSLPHFSNGADRLKEQPRPRSVQTFLLAGDADVGAWKSECNDIHRLQLRSAQFVNVSILLHIRQALFRNPYGKRLYIV